MQLNAIDVAILEALQNNARVPMADLAARLGVAPSTCQRRLARIEDGGLIEGYIAHLNEEKLGYGGSVIVHVTLSTQSEAALNAFEAAVVEIPEVVECYLMAGESDYLLLLTVRDMRDFERIHKLHLSRLPHISRLQSNTALRRIVRKPPPVPR